MTKYTRLIIIAAIAILAGSCANHRQPAMVKNDVTRMGLTGKVKAAIDSFFKIDPDAFGGQPQPTCIFIDSFDETGAMLVDKIAGGNGKIINRKTYQRNSNGNTAVSLYSQDGALEGRAISKSDGKGNELEYDYSQNDGSSWSKTIYKYDEKGDQVEEAHYEKDSLTLRTLRKFDGMGKVVEENDYDSGGSLSGKRLFKNDENGNKIKMWEYNAYGQLIEEDSLTYNGSGSLLHAYRIKKKPDDGPSPEEDTYEYDAHGNWIKEMSYQMKPGGERIPFRMIKKDIAYY